MFRRSTGTRLFQSCRRFRFEQLEDRRLLAFDPATAWSATERIPVASDDEIRPSEFSSFVLNDEVIQQVLHSAPLEFTFAKPAELALPTPDGKLALFEIVESPIMEPALAAKLQDVATYRGRGLSDSTATVRLTVSPLGISAQIRSQAGTYFVRPNGDSSSDAYLSFFAQDLPPDPNYVAEEHDIDFADFVTHATLERNSMADGEGPPGGGAADGAQDPPPTQTTGPDLRTYRLAVAATGEFTARHGGTVNSAQTKIVEAINEVNGLYEDEFSIRFTLVDNTSIVYANAATDPYTNNNNVAMLGENQTNLDAVIGNANYDIGHVFGTAGGGVAFVGVAGLNGRKGQGVSANNLNFSTQTVSHEIGHQFGTFHTWNGANGSCTASQWDPDFSMEPGSGSTIMSYAGFCGVDNTQTFRDDYFHSVSFDAIVNHAVNAIPSVGTIVSTGNSAPIVSAGPDYTIPANTPFELVDGTATDPDGDTLTFNWEQRDLGTSQKSLASPDDGLGPLFRTYPRTTDSTRTLPRINELLNNTTPLGEQLPTANRTINFRLNAVDGRGGVASDAVVLTVIDTGAPFAILSPNTEASFPTGSTQTVTWNVAGTDSNGIDAANVDILLSTDGGITFPTVLASGAPNDGSHDVVLPNVSTGSARIKIEGSGSIFFDISDANFSIGSVPLLICRPFENFDAASTPNLPEGWTTTSTNNNDWLTVGTGSDSAPNHAFVANIGAVSDNRLTSPVIPIAAPESQLRFRSSFNTESTYDGGVLEISINGGTFEDVIAAGGSFVTGGYTNSIDTGFSNPLAGRQAWTGNSGGYIDTEVQLPANVAGQNVQFRWRMGTDNSVAEVGWRIDTIELCQVGFNVNVDLPSGSGPNDVVIRKNGDDLEVYDVGASEVLSLGPLNASNSLTVTGRDAEVDNISVDYSFGGFFALPGGIHVAGGSGSGDVVTVTGTGATQAVYSMAMSPAGQTQLAVTEGVVTDLVRYDDFESITFNGMSTFESISALNVGSSAITIGSTAPAELGGMTMIAGGTLTSSSELILGPEETLIGSGVVAGTFSGASGSLIQLNGDMSIGNSKSSEGFSTDGVIDTGSHTLTLFDADQAGLGALTALGEASLAGALISQNGLLLNPGSDVLGVGIVNTPNDATRPLTNNGSIRGNNSFDRISLTGYLTGLGTIDHVALDGTLSPGTGPAAVQYGEVTTTSSSNTIVEVGGTEPGGEHDQINHSGAVVLDGSLDVRLINDFVPEFGSTLEIVTWAASRSGDYAGYIGELLTDTIAVLPTWDANRLNLTFRLFGDANSDGRVTNADISPFILALTDRASYEIQFPVNNPDIVLDFNGDGRFSNADISGFITILTGG